MSFYANYNKTLDSTFKQVSLMYFIGIFGVDKWKFYSIQRHCFTHYTENILIYLKKISENFWNAQD